MVPKTVSKGTDYTTIYNIQCDEDPTRLPPIRALLGNANGIVERVGTGYAKMYASENLAARRKPLKEEVFDVLHERILAGEYPAGQWLRQEEISSRLGVSMTPVREALDLIVSAGLAERVPYRGVRVLKPTPPEILDSYAMRLLLECSATHAAARRITPGELSQLLQLLETSRSLVRLEDLPRERAASRELHSLIVAAGGNPLQHRLYLTVLNTFPDWMLYEHLFRHPEMLEESMRCEYAEHEGIIAAISARDPELAAEKTLEHVTNRGRELIAFLGIPAHEVDEAEKAVLPLLRIDFQAGKPRQKETS